ncbi:MAG: helix-turn-helix domain-containing protein [Chloroflexi bacterium]|nr:helix-turn-helix domain-containing protein [Chloroflexota bacterium]MCI0576780.1 helix-turn-helix domain-containing protein [Chloroflexota bacterium]MCI0645344.1 helix-turn-helix domain-containing protein [Chloroflexota bacterium]MCI0725108.1 helix-turn-helix domain-containing protein [Chloroflexota bacterium]
MKEQQSANKVTLNDVLRLVLPLNTLVMGGEHTDRVVHWVAMLTGLDILMEQVQPGDLVILPPALQGQIQDGELVEALGQLGESPAAALLTFRPVAGPVAQAAAKYELPILVVTGDASLREIHQGVAALLIDRQKQITERGMQLYRRLTEMSREGQGLEAMTEIMSQLTGKIVVVQDKRLEIQAMTIPPNSEVDEKSIRGVLGDYENLPPVLRNRKAAARARQSHWQQLLPVNNKKMARLLSPIISGDRARGYLSLIGSPDELDLLDTLTAEHGAAACALEMAKAKAVSEAKKALRGDFLEGLLAGSLPEKEIERLAGRLDHNTSQPHAVMTFAWDGPEIPSLRRLETTVNWLLSSHNRPALTHIYSDDHVCVFQALEDSDEDMPTTRELAHRLREHLRAEYPRSRLLGGLSGPAKTLAAWPETHRQAVQAMQVGKRLQLDQLVEFNSLGIYQLLAQLDNLPALRRFCNQLIGPLARYDKQHRSGLVQTITAYFNHHGNISQTAEALFIHRNTLLYRLERIQELTGQDLNQADMRLALHLALKLWQLQPEVE